MRFARNGLAGRALLLALLASCWTLFGLWFTAVGPFSRTSLRRAQSRANAEARATTGVGAPAPVAARRWVYPLAKDAPAPSLESAGAPPDFDPAARGETLPTKQESLLGLARRLPDGPSCLIALRLDALRKRPWARSVLSGRHLQPVRQRLLRLGFDPLAARRAVAAVALEARAPGRPAAGPDVRFLGRRDRPFYLIAEGRMPRRKILETYRLGGPLTAHLALGRRVYRRPGAYSLAFPVPGLAAWAYRLPVGPLLQGILSATRNPTRHRRWFDALRAVGLGAATRPTPRAADAALPWITAVWVARPGVAPPWPLNQVKGYTVPASLWGAVFAVDAAPGHPDRVRVRLWLLYRDTTTPPTILPVLRYARQTLANLGGIRRAQLSDWVRSIQIRNAGRHVAMRVILRPWHLRALTLLAHKRLTAR